MSATVLALENPLRDAHPVARGEGYLLVTDDACFKVGAELRRLVAGMPRRGAESDYRRALAELGSPESFDALRGNGTLVLAHHTPFHREVLSWLSRPRLRLLGAAVQERAFAALAGAPSRLGASLFAVNVLLASLGAALSAGVWASANAAAAGGGAAVVALVVAGMMIHELGHSATAWGLGLGARPIGLSLYLYCPVLYTNVSGIRSLDLRGQVAVSLGGFAAQTAYMLALGAAALLTGRPAFASALLALSVLLIFNLNPLLRTDGYWCLRDAYDTVREKGWAKALYAVYWAAFTAYTAYLVWRGGAMLTEVARRAAAEGAWTAVATGKLLLCAYLGVMLAQGVVDRFREGFGRFSRIGPFGWGRLSHSALSDLPAKPYH